MAWNPNILGWQPFAPSPDPSQDDPYAALLDPSYGRSQAIGQGLTNAGAALLMGGDPRIKSNFGQALGRGLSAFSQGVDQGTQQGYQRAAFRLQMAKAGPEMEAAQRENRMGRMTENYYRRQQGLSELPLDGPLPSAGGSSPAGAPQLASASGVAPGVSPAANAFSQGAPQQQTASGNWRQQLYGMGMGMLGVPGLADKAPALIEAAQKAPDGFQFTPDFQQLIAIGGGPQDPNVMASNAGMKAGAEARAKAPYEFHTVGPGAAGFFGGAGGGSVGGAGVGVSGGGAPPRDPLAGAPRVSQPGAVPPAAAPGPTGSPAGAPQQGGIYRQGGMIVNTNTPQQLNISTDQSHSYRNARGTALSGTMDKIQEAGQAAADSIRQMGELSASLKRLPTGNGTDVLNEGAKWVGRFGWDLNQILPANLQTDPVAYDTANKNISELAMVVARANFPGGRITNSDLASAIRATPNLFNMPGANQILIDNLQNTMRLKLEQARFFRQYENAQPGAYGGIKAADKGEIDDGVWDAWSQQIATIKNIPDNIKQSFLSYSDFNGGNSPAPSQSLSLPQGADMALRRKSDGRTIYRVPQQGGGFKYTDDSGKEVQP